eukprot:131404_1
MISGKETNNGQGWNMNHNINDIKQQKTTNNNDNNDNSGDDDLDVIEGSTLTVNKDTHSVENINSIVPVLEFGAPFIVEKHNAKFVNVKNEIQCNTFHPLKSKEWNQLLKSCLLLSRSQKARESG